MLPAPPRELFHPSIDVGDETQRVGHHQGVEVRLDQARLYSSDSTSLRWSASSSVMSLETIRYPRRISARSSEDRHHDAGGERLSVLATARLDPFVLSVLQSGLERLLGRPGADLLVGVEEPCVLPDDLVGEVTIVPTGALIEQEDPTVQVGRDDRVLGGGLQDVLQKSTMVGDLFDAVGPGLEPYVPPSASWGGPPRAHPLLRNKLYSGFLLPK